MEAPSFGATHFLLGSWYKDEELFKRAGTWFMVRQSQRLRIKGLTADGLLYRGMHLDPWYPDIYRQERIKGSTVCMDWQGGDGYSLSTE